MESCDGTCLYFQDPLKQKKTTLYQGDAFKLHSVQYIFDQNTERNNMFTIVKCLISTTAKIVNAGNSRHLTVKLDGIRNLVVQVQETRPNG